MFGYAKSSKTLGKFLIALLIYLVIIGLGVGLLGWLAGLIGIGILSWAVKIIGWLASVYCVIGVIYSILVFLKIAK